MANPQGFPSLDSPFIDRLTGTLSLPWIQFFIALWNRSGGSAGNGSATFNYPTTAGHPDQVLTSEGAGKATIWTTVLTKLSQFANDAGFITESALTGFSTTDQTATAIGAQISARESTQIPPAISTTGAIGTSPSLARADHTHPREFGPTYVGTVSASRFAVGAATWTSGNGAPATAQPNGSIYSNTAGATGTRLYVSNGSTWTAISGV